MQDNIKGCFRLNIRLFNQGLLLKTIFSSDSLKIGTWEKGARA